LAKKTPKAHALADRPPLTPERVRKIVVQNTPQSPDDADPDTQLLTLGVIDTALAKDHKAGIQQDLNAMGWHITQGDIDSAPATTVGACRDSVLDNAF
jgi:hypothetical protein